MTRCFQNISLSALFFLTLVVVMPSEVQSRESLSRGEWITAFYVAYWNRAPDADGHAYWMGEVGRGLLTVPEVAENFAASGEARAMYPYLEAPHTATDEDRRAFIQAVYQNLLNRTVPADDEGLRYWVNELRTGNTTPGAVIGNIIYAAMQLNSQDWLSIWNKVQAAGSRIVSSYPGLDALLEAELESPSQPGPDVTYSLDLIENAYRAGDIGLEEYLLLQATAMFDHDRLPAPYRASFAPGVHPTTLLGLIEQNLENLSDAAQRELQPYVLAMDHSDSFWHDPEQALGAETRELPVARSPLRAMERPYYDGSYWRVTGTPGTEPQQRIVEEALEHAYQRFADTGFPEPTDWVRVALYSDSPLLPEGVGGVQYMWNFGDGRRCNVLLKSTLSDDDLRATTAHELFHCFQEYIETGPDPLQHPQWLAESTAVWAEDFAYPDLNTEHIWDAEFFRTLPDPFFETLGTQEYAAYFYWFYLDQTNGKTGTAVRNLMMDMYAEGTETALVEQPGFQEHFKQYALWNLNTEPMKYYEDFHGMPTGSPSGRSLYAQRIEPTTRMDEFVIVYGGGMRYFLYAIDDRVNKVTFNLSDVRKTPENENGIQVVYKVGDVWYHRDVSSLSELTFCRGRPGERIHGLIMIVSNGRFDIADYIDGVMEVDATGSCSPGWHGGVVCTWDQSGPGDGRGRTVGNYHSSGTKSKTEELVYDDVHDRFYSTSWTINVDSSYEWFHELPVPSTADVTGYTKWERREEKINAAKSWNASVPQDFPWERGELQLNIKPVTDEWDGRYLLGNSNRVFRDIGLYESVFSTYHVVGELGRMQGHVDEEWSKTSVHSVSFAHPQIELEMSIDGTKLTGSHVEENMSCFATYVFE